MNKIVASFGIAALGASTIHSASAQDFTSNPQKPWAVSATLRGFYDDNINGAPSGPNKVDSFGFEVSPGIGLDWNNGQTAVKVGYRYSLRYFDEERFQREGHDSQSHTFDGAIDHSFNERSSISLRDSFVVGQEPDLLRSTYGGGAPLTPVPGDNIRNYGSVVFSTDLTPVFGLELGYDNQWFDYDDSGGTIAQPSLSGLLDRVEQTIHVDGLWHVLPKTTLFLGYQFGFVNYTADELINGSGAEFSESSDKNNRSHYIYAGVTQVFSPDLTGSVRAGARIIDFYNADRDDVSPYVRASLKYVYAPESSLEAGGSYDISMAPYRDAAYAETMNIFASVRHRIVPKLFGSLTAQVQNQDYKGGVQDGRDDVIYTIGANLEYAFLPNLSGHVGYNFDSVDSDAFGVDNDYQRNRVYIGVTATY